MREEKKGVTRRKKGSTIERERITGIDNGIAEVESRGRNGNRESVRRKTVVWKRERSVMKGGFDELWVGGIGSVD